MHRNEAASRLIVALDVESYEKAQWLVERLSPHVRYFKIGSVLFTREGPRVCALVKDAGAELFLDLKYHDIPNTVAGAVASAVDIGADMLTLHMSGGEAMLRAAVDARQRAGASGLILVGVTVLTHFAPEDFRALFASERRTEDTVVAFAHLAADVGLNGVVASARELPLIRRRIGEDMVVVTPGIRPAQSRSDDQVRVVTPRQAIGDGADYLVVGRPVIAASDPVAACMQILEDMVS